MSSSSSWSRRRLLAGAPALVGAAALTQLGCSPREHAAVELDSDPARLDLLDAARAVRAGRLSPTELTRACLARIERIDPALNAFITVTGEQALAQARQAEAELAGGQWRGPLHGMPIALKDNIDTAGVRTTAASAVFKDRVPAADAEVVQRLRAAGAVILGKLNLHEFSEGTTSAISHFGPVHNPWNLAHVAGGSSGGSAAAVAASLCFGAVGTDTGGSIRIPAACCGVVGFKPSYGLVSSRGVVPVSNSFDHVGPLCRSVVDARLMLGAMSTHRVVAALDGATTPEVSALRIGVFRAPAVLCDAPLVPEVQAALDAAIERIRGVVAEVRETELPMPESLGRLIDSEAYAYHAPHLEKTPERYDGRTRALLLAGRAVTAAQREALHHDLVRHRSLIHESFKQVDLVVLPTLPGLPLKISAATEPFALDACTFAFSLGGLPCISVPCGFSSSGLPIGLLIGGPPLADSQVFALAHAYEQATDWHLRRPQT